MLFAIFREGAPARGYTNQILAILILSVILAFFPLLGFAFHFGRAKRSELARYRAIVEGHARSVERRWYSRPYPVHVSSEESSSLTDLNSIYECARTMRIVPYRRSHLVAIVLAALVPMLPVVSSIASLHEIVRKVLKELL